MMAWQSPSNMGLGNGMGSGGAGDAVQGSQSQGTEYTLQGTIQLCSYTTGVVQWLMLYFRCYALPADGMASTRT